MDKKDILNAVVTDVVADQIVRAMELGFKREEATAAVARGMDHAFAEHHGGVNVDCDGINCKSPNGEVRLMPLNDGGNANLCYDCYVNEKLSSAVTEWRDLKISGNGEE